MTSVYSLMYNNVDVAGARELDTYLPECPSLHTIMYVVNYAARRLVGGWAGGWGRGWAGGRAGWAEEAGIELTRRVDDPVDNEVSIISGCLGIKSMFGCTTRAAACGDTEVHAEVLVVCMPFISDRGRT